MSGKKLFNIFYPVLLIISYILIIIPHVIVRNFWIYLDLLPGYIGVGFRYSFAKRLAKKIGKNVYFGRSIEIIGWKNVTIGSNVSIHKGCYLIAEGGLQIGDNVSIAHSCSLLTTQHSYLDDTDSIRYNEIIMLPLKICNDVWIGCGCRIMAGVTIHNRAVVGAGSVVTKDVPDHSVVVGVPAKKIKDIS